MIQLFAGSILLSLLHSLLPNHWLPLLAIGHNQKWSANEITRVTFLCGCAHALSTVLIGFVLGLAGQKITADLSSFSRIIAPSVLIVLGIYFIWQHHRHYHFHIHIKSDLSSRPKIVATLSLAMFLSPCLEIEGFFLVAGAKGIISIIVIALVYTILSISGMVIWVRWVFRKSMVVNWHALEHNAGIITGLTLIVTGIITFFVS